MQHFQAKQKARTETHSSLRNRQSQLQLWGGCSVANEDISDRLQYGSFLKSLSRQTPVSLHLFPLISIPREQPGNYSFSATRGTFSLLRLALPSIWTHVFIHTNASSSCSTAVLCTSTLTVGSSAVPKGRQSPESG